MMRPALSWLPLIAFLQAHIHSIDHHTLVLVYDDLTHRDALAIAEGLHTAVGTPLMFVSLTTFQEKQVIDSPDLLLMMLLSVKYHSTLVILFGNYTECSYRRSKYIILAKPDVLYLDSFGDCDVESRMFHVAIASGGIEFMVWSAENYRWDSETPLIVYKDVPSFVASDYWLAFTDKHVSPPVGKSLRIDAPIANPLSRRLVWYNGRLMMTGIDVGLGKIVADQIGLSSVTYNHNLAVYDVELRSVNHVDPRLSNVLELESNTSMLMYQGYRFGFNVALDHLVYMAPRRMLRSGQIYVNYGGCRMIFIFMGITIILSAVRWFTRNKTHSSSENTVYLFFDTFCRLLSNSSARRTGDSNAERWALVVVSFAAILTGCLCASSLYERLIVNVEEPYYKTTEDLCRNDIPIYASMSHMPMEFSQKVFGEKNPFQIQYRWTIIPFLPNISFLVEESAAGYLSRLGHHYQLGQTYGSINAAIWYSHWFMVKSVETVLRHCFEHGFHQALSAAANHSIILTVEAPKTQMGQSVKLEIDMDLVMTGWAIATVVFVGEMLVHYIASIRHVVLRFIGLHNRKA